jgi:serine/threonine-protein kinase
MGSRVVREALPDTIGRYRIVRLIGRGAMGVVYLAHDPLIDRNVAIKLVLADLLLADDRDAFLERFQREAQAAGRCLHPNIVTVFDYALHEGNPYLAMEFVEGGSLANLRAGGAALPVPQAVNITLQILEGLQAAHAQGVVHRDIKPANILLTPQGQVKITDFGVARLARTGLTQSGTIVGTLSYMSPEQCRGEAVDARADLFAVTAILHELLLGKRPFPGTTEAEVMAKLLYEPLALPEAPAMPSALLDILRVGLGKKPEERFAGASTMADALRRAGTAGAGSGEHTVIQPRAPATATTPRFDASTLAELERELAAHLGPIARAMVQSAARRAPTLEALRDMLAKDIDRPAERDQFLRAVTRTGQTGTASPAAGIDAAMQDAAQKALARTIGPIASVIVRRAAAQAKSPAAFWEILAGHIDNPTDRDEFLKHRA